MITVLAGGDSFIFGAELADQIGGTHSKSTIPALLAGNVGAEYRCTAVSGSSNSAIARRVMDACQASKDDDLFVFVMWTFTHRYEFRFNYNTGRRDSPWYSINLWDIEDDLGVIGEQFVTPNDSILQSHRRNKEYIDRVGLTDFAKNFYKHVGSSEYYETYSSLKEIVLLQQYLELNEIPYLFCTADAHLKDNAVYSRHQSDPSTSTLYDQIRWDNWYLFPPGEGVGKTPTPRGFYQWAVENKYSVGTTHPLEKAHSDAAILMKEKFNELVTKSTK